MPKATTTDAEIAAFLARGGSVTKVETGMRAIASDRRMYLAFRDGRTIAADAVEAERARAAKPENAGASISDALDESIAAAKSAYRRRLRAA